MMISLKNKYTREERIAREIAKAYSIATEIGMTHKDANDPDKITYLEYREICKGMFPVVA